MKVVKKYSRDKGHYRGFCAEKFNKLYPEMDLSKIEDIDICRMLDEIDFSYHKDLCDL